LHDVFSHSFNLSIPLYIKWASYRWHRIGFFLLLLLLFSLIIFVF
jgi:hypothetical protein